MTSFFVDPEHAKAILAVRDQGTVSMQDREAVISALTGQPAGAWLQHTMSEDYGDILRECVALGQDMLGKTPVQEPAVDLTDVVNGDAGETDTTTTAPAPRGRRKKVEVEEVEETPALTPPESDVTLDNNIG